MPLIIRIDVDRPYGRRPIFRHCLSRLSSDLYFPRVPGFGYLTELRTMLAWLNEEHARAYVFFRRCTLPSKPILELIESGGHEIGLHLENSRSYATFQKEVQILERHVGRKVRAVSKHGSGGAKFGFHHHAPYEPEKLVVWAKEASMQVFLGNLQDPTIEPTTAANDLTIFPAAFWLEPPWRDTRIFTINWLLDRARSKHLVLLVHPENVLADPDMVADFKTLIHTQETAILQ